jgi:hypothetical protein
MATNNGDSGNPFEAFAAHTNGELKKFSDELLTKMKGKLLEIYIGDQFETIEFDDYSQPQNCVVIGKLVDVLDRVIVLECYYVDKKTKELRKDNRVFLNSFQIRAMTELDGKGSLGDIFLSVNDAPKIRALVSKTGQ